MDRQIQSLNEGKVLLYVGCICITLAIYACYSDNSDLDDNKFSKENIVLKK